MHLVAPTRGGETRTFLKLSHGPCPLPYRAHSATMARSKSALARMGAGLGGARRAVQDVLTFLSLLAQQACFEGVGEAALLGRL